MEKERKKERKKEEKPLSILNSLTKVKGSQNNKVLEKLGNQKKGLLIN